MLRRSDDPALLGGAGDSPAFKMMIDGSPAILMFYPSFAHILAEASAHFYLPLTEHTIFEAQDGGIEGAEISPVYKFELGPVDIAP